MGNGDRRPFTEAQIDSLLAVIERLQRVLGIPRQGVHLHQDIAEVSSPGKFFPAARLEERLRREAAAGR